MFGTLSLSHNCLLAADQWASDAVPVLETFYLGDNKLADEPAAVRRVRSFRSLDLAVIGPSYIKERRHHRTFWLEGQYPQKSGKSESVAGESSSNGFSPRKKHSSIGKTLLIHKATRTLLGLTSNSITRTEKGQLRLRDQSDGSCSHA